MYTLTRKLSVICLTVVLSFLVYGCGGSSKQALITDVSTDMVTAGLTPDPGTYTIQPGGTANAGDVTFTCPAEGPSCEVTVAEDGTVTSAPGSAPGMATAMDSASAAARLAAEEAARVAEAARLAAVAEAEASEAARVAAVAAAEASEAARVAAVAAAEASEAARVAAVAAANAAEAERLAAVAAAEMAETERLAAVAAAEMAETERLAAVAAAEMAETERLAAVAAAEMAETERLAAVAALRLVNLRLNASDVDLDELDDNFMTITEGVYTIRQGRNMDAGDANFQCPADAADPCEVTVDEDGNVTSAGGMATAQNSVAAMNTMTAIALSAVTALGTQEEAAATGAPATVGVSRSPSGDTTIELTHDADATNEVEYDPGKAVDTGHEIAGWMGQTLKRDNSEAADTEADTDAVPADEMDEATFYTNIDPAKPGKLKDVPATGVEEIAVDADLMLDGLTDEDDTFRAELIRTDGTRIPGTFTCDADSCAAVTVDEDLVLGVTVLAANPGTGWEFESDDNVKEGETPDADYTYFGYWLKSPVGDGTTDYAFATFSDGNADFVSANRTLYGSTNLTATYEGGAAGMYVSRELRLVNGLVDEHSPGTYGRFTAKAELEANFGTHDDLVVDGENVTVTNTIHGTISEFRNGDTDLGFEVTLGRATIDQGTGAVSDGDYHGNVW